MPNTAQYRPKSPARGTPTDEGDFVVFEHVAVFDSHVGDDGTEYGGELLQQIAETCNRRIRDTDDWCPVVLAHTRQEDEKADVNDNPPVIGLAGPFYVSEFGKENPRPCIFCSFWIFPEHEATFLKNPRRSVEIWPEERPEDRYFDPIAILGSETPRRDLGMIYSRRSGGGTPVFHYAPGPLRYSKRTSGQKIRYSEPGSPVSTPGANNTFIPGPGGAKKKKPLHNSKGDLGMFSPDELQQIMEALKPSIESMVMAATSVVDDTEPGEVAAEDPSGIVDAAPMMDGAGDSLEDFGGEVIPEADDIPAVAEPPVVDEGPPAMDDEDDLYARGLGKKFMKYMKDGELSDEADLYMATMDDDDQAMMDHYMKNVCDSDDAKDKYAARYDKSGIGGEDITEKPGDCAPSGTMCEGEMSAGTADKYQKERKQSADKYRKLEAEHSELKVRYNKQSAEVEKYQKSARDASRESILTVLSQEYAFEIEDEKELTGDFTDAQFERHTSRTIPERYQKVSGDLIPVGGAEKRADPNENPAAAESPEDEAQQYAEKAGELVMRYRRNGKPVKYKNVLDNLTKNKGDLNEEQLLAVTGNGRA